MHTKWVIGKLGSRKWALSCAKVSHILEIKGEVHFVTWPLEVGEHRDTYLDFEKEISSCTGWKQVQSGNIALQKIFDRFFFPALRNRSFYFDLPGLMSDRILFSVLSGWDYVKIFPHYLFRGRLKAMYQFDTWQRDYPVHENAFRSFRINIAFLSIRGAAAYFDGLGIPGFSAHWVPEGVDSARFRFRPVEERTTSVLQYGRRWEWLHDRLQPWCEREGISYRYPPHDQAKRWLRSRGDLVEILSRTKVVVAVPRLISHPEAGDLSTVTTRFFEGMAAKCLLWGSAPQDLIALFGYNPVVEIDRGRPAEQLKYILAHYEQYIPLIEKNHAEVLVRHQWRHRIADMVRFMKSHLTEREAKEYFGMQRTDQRPNTRVSC